jgi:catalase
MQMPDPAVPARTPIDDLAPLAQASILLNGPETFKGRKLGILVSDGVARAMERLPAAQSS